MKNFSVRYRCAQCAAVFETVIASVYKSTAASETVPLLHSCPEFRGDPQHTQGIAHAFAVREL